MVNVMVEQSYVVSNRAVCKFGDTTALSWYFGEKSAGKKSFLITINRYFGTSIDEGSYMNFGLGCIVPATLQPGTVDFSVTLDGMIWSSNTLPFTYHGMRQCSLAGGDKTRK